MKVTGLCCASQLHMLLTGHLSGADISQVFSGVLNSSPENGIMRLLVRFLYPYVYQGGWAGTHITIQLQLGSKTEQLQLKAD